MSPRGTFRIGLGGTPRPVMAFAAAAHFLHHVVTSLYFTLVLMLVAEWSYSYNDLIALWTLGALLVGLGSPLAGWLGDRFGETRVIIGFFFGMGLASILCGLADGPGMMQVALTIMGVFGSVYHPVGNAWVVHHARERGKAVALAGIAGSVGVAAGPVTAAVLNDLFDWRWAFIIPGIVTVAFGLAMLAMHFIGRMPDRPAPSAARHDAAPPPPASEINLALALLALTMTLTLVVINAFITALPKWVEDGGLVQGGGLIGVGLLTGTIHFLAAGAQFVGGHYADRGAVKRAYVGGFALLSIAFALCAAGGGWAIVALGIAVVFIFEGIAPLETIFVARYAPEARRGLFFGVRYALAVVGGPLGVSLVALLYDPATGFTTLMLALAAMSAVITVVALALPRDGAPQPASMRLAGE